MTGKVGAAGILELTFTFNFTGRASPLMICIWKILCCGLLAFVNATVPSFPLCGLKEKGNKSISSHLSRLARLRRDMDVKSQSGFNIQL